MIIIYVMWAISAALLIAACYRQASESDRKEIL